MGMNKKTKKMGIVLLLLMLTASALAACGNTKNAGNGKGADASAAPTTAATKAPKEKVTLRILGENNMEEFPAGSDVNNNVIINELRERTGFDIQWELMPKDPEVARQKLNVLMASGDTPDLIILSNKGIFGNFVQQGLLTPLNDLLESDGPDIKSTLTEEQWKSATFEDQIYAVRTVNFSSAVNGLLARKDLLAAAGVGEIKTQEEFYQALKALKAKDPSIIPYAANLAQGLSSLDAIASMFYPPVDYVQQDGKVVYTPLLPAAKEFLAFANKLYAEGLIDQEAIVSKSENLKEKLVSGQAAMSTVGWYEEPSISKALAEKKPGAEMVFMAPPVGDNGAAGFSRNSTTAKYFMIPKASKHAQEVMQFLNKVTNDEIINLISFGLEGTHYELKDSKLVALPEQENIRYRVYYNMFDTIELGLQRLEQKGFAPYFEAVNKTAKHENVVNLVPPVELVDKTNQELIDLRNEYFLKMITGALPLSAYDEYVTKFKKLGGEAVIEALNTAYNGN
ncbi:extracellular solute-binding protein [Paenibacillus sinopodophylli]|uniref:extracellular solute-binding protein n=1 Tax=Paenibacillus sinopodophylli TaxID=1837342 RepID=UPI00110CD0B2|nr:extracellular solute-binding protein [Paenibacillus sinopodophylli]